MNDEILRTPDDRFADLPGPRFEPHYVELPYLPSLNVRMHYVDEGPRDAPPVLLLHGEPTWSFLWRNVVPVLRDAGLRVLAPDLVGFGRSDKPVSRTAYSFHSQVTWVRGFLDKLGIDDVRLLCHDWGGLIGLRLVGEEPERFARVLATNTGLPTGDQAPLPAFTVWQKHSQAVPQLMAGKVVASAVVHQPAPEILAAYDAPFPDERYKAGIRQMPLCVPTTPDDPAAEANRRAWTALMKYTRPFLTVFGDSDAVTANVDMLLQKRIPGCKGQAHARLHAGHFIQEDAPVELAAHARNFFAG